MDGQDLRTPSFFDKKKKVATQADARHRQKGDAGCEEARQQASGSVGPDELLRGAVCGWKSGWQGRAGQGRADGGPARGKALMMNLPPLPLPGGGWEGGGGRGVICDALTGRPCREL